MASEVSGIGLAAIAAGSVLAYGGITGKSPLQALYLIVRGKSPAEAAQVTGLATATSSAGRARTDFANIPGNTGDATPSGGGSGNMRAIVTQLSTHIRNRYALAGIAGNIDVESGGSPAAYNAGENAIGLCQWEGGRRGRLQAFAAKRGTTETDLSTQVEFIWHELTGTESATLLPLLAVTSPEAGAYVFDTMYERSTRESLPTRQAAARKWYNTLYGGK